MAGKRKVRRSDRRGVTSVLSMMFLILFGSLAGAMAIVSQGNVRTAAAHLHVMRAMGASETGLRIAQHRLAEATSRFVVEKGTVDGTFGAKLWEGTYTSADGEVVVLPPPSGHAEFGSPTGIAEAIANLHAADENIVGSAGIGAPTITSAPAGAGSDYRADGWVFTPVLALEGTSDAATTGFSVVYAPLANGMDVRVIVYGYDFTHERKAVPLTRVISQDFRVVKRINQAIVSPSRVMIGKNVLVTGDLGARYLDVGEVHGNPVTLKSDFHGLDPVLDSKLDDFFANLKDYDVDGDNRLRYGHPAEGQGIPDNDYDYDGDGNPDGAFLDATQDGYLDEFDIFIRHYDANGDGMVALSDALRAGTINAGLAAEFVDGSGNGVDDHLALLLDSSFPDRNRNGVYGFEDMNNDGMWNPGAEALLDWDVKTSTYADHVLGYRDGVIDRRDRYAKVSGRVVLKASESDWIAANPDYRDSLRGPIKPPQGQGAMVFNATDQQLPDVTVSKFTSSQTALQSAADGADFAEQVAANLGIAVAQLATYVEPGVPETPQYYRLDPDANGDGRPDNYQEAYFEKMPFNSPNFSDWYYRPVYKNMAFKDVQIPIGTNALFVNCTFAGVTWVRTHTSNSHVNWTLYGRMQMGGDGYPKLEIERYVYGDDPGEINFPQMLPASALPPNQLLVMAMMPLDKADIPHDQIPTIINYAELADPLVIGGKRVTDTRAFSNNIRFHDCLMVGSIISDSPGEYTHVRNKVQFTGKTRFVSSHPATPDDPKVNPEPGDLSEIEKSSMMLPNYSVDVGQFNSPPEQDIRLRGVVVAGVLDIRGNASIHGALLMTFKPAAGEGPLKDPMGSPVGSTANFNTTIGYFGPEDGDQESLDPATLPTYQGVKIVGWDLDGDGLPDLGPDSTPTPEQFAAGAAPVPFHGYGRVELRFDPNMMMPDGVLLPLQLDARASSYREGLPW